jgi:hypothetical protein
MSLAGCSTWKPLTKAQIAPTITEQRPTRIRLTQTQPDKVVELRHPTLHADTLYGSTETPSGNIATAIPLNTIESGAIRQNNRKTSRIIAGSAFALGIVFAIEAMSVPPIP